jgi:hypothetical protein
MNIFRNNWKVLGAGAFLVSAVIFSQTTSKPKLDAHSLSKVIDSAGLAQQIPKGYQAQNSPGNFVPMNSAKGSTKLSDVESTQLAELDSFLHRAMLGQNISNREYQELTAKLEEGVGNSEFVREQLRNRLSGSFQREEMLTVYELERLLASRPEGMEKLLPLYEDIVAKNQPLKIYALQQLGQFQNLLPEERQLQAFEQAERSILSSDADMRSVALEFINRSATDNSFEIPEHFRSQALQSAASAYAEAQDPAAGYQASRAMFRLYGDATRATPQAYAMLSSNPNLGLVHGTLVSMASGHVSLDPVLFGQLEAAFNAGHFEGFNADEVRSLITTLAPVITEMKG